MFDLLNLPNVKPVDLRTGHRVITVLADVVEAIRQRGLGITFHALAEQTGLAVNTIKNIAHDLIEELERTVDYETLVIMGIDEVRLAGDDRCVI